MAKKLDATCSARLREDLASRTHLRLALARYFVSHQIDATGPTNRPVCEKAVDACWTALQRWADVSGTEYSLLSYRLARWKGRRGQALGAEAARNVLREAAERLSFA